MNEHTEKNGNDASSPRREHELLLHCARSLADDETKEKIRGLVREGIDFDYLIQLARRHLILPLLFHQLNKSVSEIVPPAYLQNLKKSYRDNAARNLYHAGELQRILDAFSVEGIEVVPFKGPTLALFAYRDLSLRRFIDLDLLVRRQDIRGAKEVLISRGYQLFPALTPAQESLLLNGQHALQFIREGGNLIVELHWSIVPRKFAESVCAEDMWGRIVKKRMNGSEVFSLSTEDLLLGLCVHGTKHLWERLIWICDIAELLNSSPDLKWAEVMERARVAGVERMLLLGLLLAAELLGAALPDEIKGKAARDAEICHLTSLVRARLFDGADYKQAGFIQNIRFNLLARQGWRDRIRYYGFILSPTDGDIAALRLPSALSFMYYFLRPLRLLIKGEAGH